MPTTLPIEKVLPDKSQPREYFNAQKMMQIRESIKAEGIAQPLDVMDNEDGTYLLIDGERRYRAAMELGLREIPVTINPKMTDEERFVRQFHMQEYREEWTPIEKAQSIVKIAETLGMTLEKTCEYLKVTPRDTRRYIAFALLADKPAYLESGVPLEYAESIKGMKAVARKVASDELDSGLSHNDERILEARVISMVQDGTIKNRAHITKISDSIRKEPEVLRKLLDTSIAVESPEALFREAKAKGAFALRNTVFSAKYIIQHGKVFLDNRDVKVSIEEYDTLGRARDMINRILDVA